MRYKNFSYAKYGYIFSIPFVLAFLFFSFYPLLYTVTISFSDMAGAMTVDREYGINRNIVVDDITGETTESLDPFGNYRTVLNMQGFKRALSTTFTIWMINFIPQLLLALVLAVWFTSRWTKLKGQGVFKLFFYMPNIITAGSIAALFYAFFMFPKGVVNDTLMNLKVIDSAYNFAQDSRAQRLIVSFIQFWMWYGYTMLIFISGILGLNPEMYESADIDGAGVVKQFFFITLPNLKTILLYMLVTSVIGGLNMFDIPYLYSQGGPSGATTTTSIFIYNQAFAGARRYNMASAASVIMFFIIAVLSAMLFFIMRDKDTAQHNKLLRKEARSRKRGTGGLF